jgi:hypothetical protein|tara:strand:- start:486 stop:830 length:345 start_codon:yes stop_codon:yes gene_type:complete
MTSSVQTEKEILQEKPEMKFDTSAYSCEILLEKTTFEKACDKSFPTDAFIVKYTLDGKEVIDVTRSEKMVNVFDMYYDRYGKGAVQKIDFGYGTVRPNLWGAKAPEKKKRKRKL